MALLETRAGSLLIDCGLFQAAERSRDVVIVTYRRRSSTPTS